MNSLGIHIVWIWNQNNTYFELIDFYNLFQLR